MRRFENRTGSASKFWQVDVRGKDVEVRFGRIGTDGQAKTKRAASADAAQKEADRLVREKLAKGYFELRAGKPPGAAPSSKPPVKQAPKQPPAKRPALPKQLAGQASVAELWARITRWFTRKHPELDLRLRPGASDKAIASAEKALGVRFPDDFRASLRIHDGQHDDCLVVGWLPAERLGSLASLVACWKGDRAYFNKQDLDERFEQLSKDGRVRQVHLHPKQIPFAGSRYWDYDRLLFDFVPGQRGSAGQIIKRDDCDLVHVSATFRDLLARIASDLERGRVVPFKNE